MMAVLLVKYGCLCACWGFREKALVIDEPHAYDVYMSKILTLLFAMVPSAGNPCRDALCDASAGKEAANVVGLYQRCSPSGVSVHYMGLCVCGRVRSKKSNPRQNAGHSV